MVSPSSKHSYQPSNNPTIKPSRSPIVWVQIGTDIDGEAAGDFSGWSAGGRTRHIDVRYFFLWDLKESGILSVEWISGDENAIDIFTMNLQSVLFDKHARTFCGNNEYFTSKVKEGNAYDTLDWNRIVKYGMMLNTRLRISGIKRTVFMDGELMPGSLWH